MTTKGIIQLVICTLFLTTNFAQKEKFSCSAVKNKPKFLKSNTLSLAQIAQTERYDVHFYSLDLNMTNTSTDLSGRVEIHGTANENLDSVCFELFDTYTISDITFNGNSVSYARNASAIKVPVNIFTNDPFVIAVTYNGTPPDASSNPLGGAGMTNDFSPTWGNQVTWSLSESFSAFEWFPCKQSLTDKADSVAVSITVPSSCKAGSNGILEQVIDLGNGFSTYKWRHRYPIDYYLISVAVAEYIDYTTYAHPVGLTDSIPIQNFIYNNPGTLPNFQADLDETADFIEHFSEIFGMYPFYTEKYGHCMAPLSGGMEHQSMTTQGFFEKTLTAHELAHQWWGDQVTCKSWSDIWVNEGFASYAEYLMLERLYPGEQVGDMNVRHNNIKGDPGGSVWVEDSLNTGRIFDSRLSYDKGAAIIHTLRFMLDDDTMFMQALRNFQNDYRFQTALGVDMKASLEAVSGLDLSAAFEEWYFGEGFPTYSAKWNVSGNDLYVVVTQSVSMPAVTPLFTNPLELKFTRVGLPDTIIRFDITAPSVTFVIPGLNTVNGLPSIDPKNWIINSVGSIQHDLTLGQSELENNIPLEQIILSPNPANELVTINGAPNESYTVKIIDPNGRICFNKQVKSGENIAVSAFPAGMYLFQIESENGKQITRKLVRR